VEDLGVIHLAEGTDWRRAVVSVVMKPQGAQSAGGLFISWVH
jgi:hypothetical protein